MLEYKARSARRIGIWIAALVLLPVLSGAQTADDLRRYQDRFQYVDSLMVMVHRYMLARYEKGVVGAGPAEGFAVRATNFRLRIRSDSPTGLTQLHAAIVARADSIVSLLDRLRPERCDANGCVFPIENATELLQQRSEAFMKARIEMANRLREDGIIVSTITALFPELSKKD